MKSLKLILLSFLLVAISCSGKKDGPEKGLVSVNLPGPSAKNLPINDTVQNTKPYVIFVSIDGYRHDYTAKYQPTNLKQIFDHGVHAKSLKPSFPTLTFPNHYSLVTGLYPENHGIVGNFFWDPVRQAKYQMNNGQTVNDGSWYGGEPLWVVAEKSGMRSGTVFWVGSEAEIAGFRASYVLPYEDKASADKRVSKVIEWLSLPEGNRPHFITLYFSVVDSAGHKYGPEPTGADVNQVRDAINEVDTSLGRLREWITQSGLPVNLIVVSDHGMKQLDPNKVVFLDESIKDELPEFTISESGSMTMLHVKNPNDPKDQKLINTTLAKLKEDNRFTALRKNRIPPDLHFSTNDRIGDIVILAAAPYYIVPQRVKSAPYVLRNKATHGWDNKDLEMHGIFYAEGPNFRKIWQ